jgi:penicillin-binding protein 1A
VPANPADPTPGPRARSNRPPTRSTRRGGTRARSRRPRWARIALGVLKWGAIAGLALVAAGSVTMAVLFWRYGADPDLPRIYTLRDYQPKQLSRVLAADGRPVGELFEERRSYVPLDRIAPIMVDAIISAEDGGFRDHQGLDFKGMIRAFWVNLRAGETRQGASTITQQVVKTFLLSPERTFRRKMQEIILARRLEAALDKDEILTLYLNQIYFGHGRYGIEEAARFYFGKGAAELTVGEASVLAGLPQSPERLSPIRHPEAAKARQAYVLEQMVRRGHLDEEEAGRWLREPIQVVRNSAPSMGTAPEYVEVARRELVERHGEAAIPVLGARVGTTVDLELQAAARQALEDGLRAIDQRHGYRRPLARLNAAKAAAKQKQLTRELPGTGPRLGESYEALVVEVSDEREEMAVDLGGWTGAVLLRGGADARYNPEGKKPSERFRKDDLVRVRLAPELGAPRTEGARGALVLDQGPQGALVAIDPRTRHVVAMVGGYGYELAQFNRALRARRQPGSSFKPFVFAAALDTGEFTPASVINDAPEVYDLWKPKNYERDQFRGPVRLREALAASINTVAIRVLADVGPDRVVALAQAAGIEQDLPRELSLALGSGVVTPLEMTNAFATFAAGGVHSPPVFVVALGDEALPAPPTTQALRPEIAYLVTSMMESVVEEGTATAAKRLRRKIAGKTGTSNEGRDAWFIGYTPELVIGVWVGFDDMRRIGRGETGGRAALPIWIETARHATRGAPATPFRQPPGVVVARIDRRTGKLAAPGQPDRETLDEVFLDGTVPTERAPAPGEVDLTSFVLDQLDLLDGDEGAAAGAE